MKFEAINEKEFLNPYHRKKPILETELNEFIKTLKDYKINLENNLKNNEDSLVANALSKFFENLSFQCEVKSIHKGNSGIDLALKKDGLTQVIIEAKLPHSREFFSPSKPNCKALHECILYYLRERKALNSSLKHIIITDFYSFFIFKADLFEELFNKNKYFKEAFENFESKNSLFKGNTDEIYKEFEKILNGDSTLKGLFVDLKPILEQDKLSFSKLKPLFKIFSKDCLLGEFNPNDANSLNNAFYKELLYILGLCESKQNSKLIIAKSKESFTFSDENTSALKAKIERIGTPLKEWYGLNINYGIKTGYNEAFIITTEKRNEILANCKDEAEKERTAKLIRKMLRGRDIKRYSYEWAGLWVINTHNGYKNQNGEKVEAINIKHYPSLKKHFDEFYPQLEKRADKGLTPYNLRNCAYLDEFEKEKIVWNPVSGEYLFSYIKEHIFFNNSLFMMTLDVFSLKYILAFMNSNCYKWLITLKTNLIQTGSYAYGAKDKIERLPIPKINSKNEKLANELINLVDEILKAKEQDKNANTQELENKINSIVYKLYNLTEEEIKIIEGK